MEFKMTKKQEHNLEINKLELWFNTFYQKQKSQAEMDAALNVEWDGADDGEKRYDSLLELQKEAKNKQLKIRQLKKEIEEVQL